MEGTALDTILRPARSTCLEQVIFIVIPPVKLETTGVKIYINNACISEMGIIIIYLNINSSSRGRVYVNNPNYYTKSGLKREE